MANVAKIDPVTYGELYEQFFTGQSIGIEHYISGDMAASRHSDIQDTYASLLAKVDKLFPGQDESTIRKIAAVGSFLERMGCESGIVFAAQQGAADRESNRLFMHRVTEYGLR